MGKRNIQESYRKGECGFLKELSKKAGIRAAYVENTKRAYNRMRTRIAWVGRSIKEAYRKSDSGSLKELNERKWIRVGWKDKQAQQIFGWETKTEGG